MQLPELRYLGELDQCILTERQGVLTPPPPPGTEEEAEMPTAAEHTANVLRSCVFPLQNSTLGNGPPTAASYARLPGVTAIHMH